MEIYSSGSTILYLKLEINSPQKKFLSVINFGYYGTIAANHHMID